MKIISAKNITKIYKSGEVENSVLRGVDLEVSEGEFVSIIGPSGAGKSTLLYSLGLLDTPTGGELTIDGVDVLALSDEEKTHFRSSTLGYVFQDYALIPELTAEENVMVPLLLKGLHFEEARQVAQQTLMRFQLDEHGTRLPSQLSGGQQQRVSIARSIAHKPKIIFADEPTANLDSRASQEVLRAFIELHKEGQTIVMVTHEMEYARMAQRMIEVSDGVIIRDSLIASNKTI